MGSASSSGMSQPNQDEDHHPSTSTSKWSSSHQVALTDSIVTFISNGLLPLSTVENKDFMNILQLAQPSFTMPTRRALRDSLIPQRSNSVKEHLANLMAKASHISLTIDLWSNRSMRSFFGMTGHFIVDFDLQTVMLSCQRFKGRHTADNIYQVYDDVLDNYSIQNKVSFIITDNASNMIKAFTLFPPVHVNSESEDEEDDGCDLQVVNVDEEIMYFPPERLPCFAHSLQLVLRDALDDAGSIKNLLSKVQKLVAFCHKSTNATEILEGIQKLQPANVTRWNSQLKMLRSVLKVPNDVLTELHCPIQLSAYELKIIHELCEVLEPFEEVTDRCQAEKAVTSSSVIPCVRGLRHAIKDAKMTGNKKFVSTLQTSFERRLVKFEDMECFQMAATLDPRFKLDWCNGEEKITIKNLLTAKVDSVCPKASATSDMGTQTRKRPRLFSYMEAQTTVVPIDVASHELPVYLSTPCLAESTHPLMFWKENQNSFPNLSVLACKYLAIPASSAPVERIFSVAGKIFRPDRCRLNDKTFEELLTIKCNNVTL